jgi:hypothetical protein
MTPHELVEHLKEPGLRQRVGLWLLPTAQLGREEEAAARLGVRAVDLRQVLLDRLPAGTRYVGLARDDGWRRLVQLVDDVGRQTHTTGVVLACQADLLIAGLQMHHRRALWDELLLGLPYLRTGIVLTVPEISESVAPSPSQLQRWASDMRLATGLP